MIDSNSESTTAPIIERMRLESVRRNLTVKHTQLLTPHMLRVTLQGEELTGFVSPSPDDHLKVFIPTPEGGAQGREYTPRHFDQAQNTLVIDFVLHEGGLASGWAQHAKPGDQLLIGGPRGSKVISAPGAWWLLIGDETALPSVGRRLEELPDGTRVFTVLAVTGADEEQKFATACNHTPVWVHRPDSAAGDPQPLIQALGGLELPPGPGFIWIATESEVSRALRSYVMDALGHPPEWTKASAYWSVNPEE